MSLPLLALLVTVAAMVAFACANLREMPSMERLLLALLRERGESYGLDLVAASEGRLQKGLIYVGLYRLECRGLVRSRLSGARRVYSAVRS